MAIYRDPDTEQAIATHSMIKTFGRCPKKTEYKYVQRLKPRAVGKPLKRGTWFHRLLEVMYSGGDWREEHQRLSTKFAGMLDEEKDIYGNLPDEMRRLMRAYLWHYAADEWKVHEVEFVLETEFPDGTLYRGKIDLLVENQFGLWIVDHKTHKSLPNLDFRLLDAQSALYVWAALRCGIKVQGHIWNYVKAMPPGIPPLLKDGTRLSNAKMDTDFPTLAHAVKEHGLPVKDYAHKLKYLRGLRYQPGEPQLSPFFKRSVLEKSNAMVRRVAQAGYHTAKRMNSYPFDRKDFVERVVDRSCTFTCEYVDVCATELYGGNADPIIRSKFQVGDPLDYYQDADSKWEEKGDG